MSTIIVDVFTVLLPSTGPGADHIETLLLLSELLRNLATDCLPRISLCGNLFTDPLPRNGNPRYNIYGHTVVNFRFLN
jgi:hypothetical protein